MAVCSLCRTMIPEGASRCPKCGASVSKQSSTGIQPRPAGPSGSQSAGPNGYQSAGAGGYQPGPNGYQPAGYGGYPYPFPQVNNQPVSMGDWVVTLLVAAIPLVGFIMYFVWAFSGGTPESKKNWARAVLIWMAIGFIPFVLAVIAIFGALLGSAPY